MTVKRTWKTLVLSGLLLAALYLLPGCSVPKMIFNPQDLYALPTLPEKYTDLNTLLSAILDGGAEYAAPTSGTNTQPVQLVDLDGDGREEAVAFFRNPNDEKPLKIYIFTAEEDSYQQSGLIEGTGTGIYSIAYEDLNGDRRMELMVGWKVAVDQQVLEVYSPRAGDMEAMVRTDYVKYTTMDLDRDQRQELVVIRADGEGDGVADYYSWQPDGSFSSQSSARISVTMAELSQQGRITNGTLSDDAPARDPGNAGRGDPGPVCHRRHGDAPGHHGYPGGAKRGTEQHRPFRGHGRFLPDRTLLLPVSHGYQRRRTDRGPLAHPASVAGQRGPVLPTGGLVPLRQRRQWDRGPADLSQHGGQVVFPPAGGVGEPNLDQPDGSAGRDLRYFLYPGR